MPAEVDKTMSKHGRPMTRQEQVKDFRHLAGPWLGQYGFYVLLTSMALVALVIGLTWPT